jgi:hypothetical protein
LVIAVIGKIDEIRKKHGDLIYFKKRKKEKHYGITDGKKRNGKGEKKQLDSRERAM